MVAEGEQDQPYLCFVDFGRIRELRQDPEKFKLGSQLDTLITRPAS